MNIQGDFRIPIGSFIEQSVEYLTRHFQGGFDAFSNALTGLNTLSEWLLLAIPAYLFIPLLAAFAFWRIGWRFSLFTLTSLSLIVGMDLWNRTMMTLALVVSATLICLILGIPLGILSAKSVRCKATIKPALDFMQTMPAFVYLIPAAMLFGLGKVPGTVATIVFAMPPAVRLTDLGISQVATELKEAGLAFGCTPAQLLLKVELPMALPAIMTGINQTNMMALSMVVIASMIGAGGLGNVVLTGIQRLDVGLGFEGGISVVILAIILDRLTQSFQSNKFS